MKQCRECGEVKSVSELVKRKDGYRSLCRPCHAYRCIKSKVKNYVMHTNSMADFVSADSCMICRESFVLRVKSMDHCHAKGIYRGALCRRCNLALGMLGDSVPNLIRAADYLVKRG